MSSSFSSRQGEGSILCVHLMYRCTVIHCTVYVFEIACTPYSVTYLTGELLCTEDEMSFLSALLCQILKKDYNPKVLVSPTTYNII